jgi:hypothetical protein
VSDRLDELRRQRDLLRGQLASLDAQIAAAERPAQAPFPDKGRPQAEAAPDPRSADAILEEFGRAPASMARQAKLGCILYFAGAMALLFLALAAIYFFEKAGRGH